jgi:N-acetylmuramoyl-L-alanine amidase
MGTLAAHVLHAAPTNRLLPMLLLGATVHAQVARRVPAVSGAAAGSNAGSNAISLSGQTAASSLTTADPAVIFIDPGHGGDDAGAHLSDGVLEKDVTLALANKLRGLLTARGFKVVMTRSSSADNASTEERIALEQRSNPSACLLLHAADGGHGVHLYTSSLAVDLSSATPRGERDRAILPWDTVQVSLLPDSIDLAGNLAAALNGAEIPLVTGHASVSPIDSLSCPAVAIELAPYTPDQGTLLQPSDAGYQTNVAKALASALTIRREHLASTGGSAANAARHRNGTKPRTHSVPQSDGVQHGPRAPAPARPQP